MSTPQKPSDRLKQKRRRTKQLAEWRARQEAKGASAKAAPAAAKSKAK